MVSLKRSQKIKLPTLRIKVFGKLHSASGQSSFMILAIYHVLGRTAWPGVSEWMLRFYAF